MRGNHDKEVQLLVLENCEACQEAEQVWRRAAEQAQLGLTVLDIGQAVGKALAKTLDLRTFPAVIIDGRLRAIGVQTLEQARELLAQARGTPAE